MTVPGSNPQGTAGDVAATAGMRLVYMVHDLGDPAVARRLAMLRPWLSSALVIGFCRRDPPPTEVEGWPAIALGRTADGKLLHRALSVLRARVLLRRLRAGFADATVVLARQLEMLALARVARERYAQAAVLAYECLDIHRLMVATSLAGTALRRLEAGLLRATDVVVVSSPAFLHAYFQPVHGARLPSTCLVENKVLQADAASTPATSARPAGPPWRIGWYGVLRCRRSLVLLVALARRLPGRVMVELRGRPALSAIPDFDALVAMAPGVRFLGPYDRRTDLAAMYQAVHFTWAIDFYEEAANSRWLLPNRLYEGGLHGAVPIALATVETGRWLAQRHAGVLLDEPLAEQLLRYFSGLQPESYAEAGRNLAAVPRSAWIDAGDDSERLMHALRGEAFRPHDANFQIGG